MISRAKYFRGAVLNSSFVGTGPMDPRAGLCWRVAAGGVGVLPDARELGGDLMLVVWNADGASAFDVEDNDGGAVANIPSGEVRLIALSDNTTQAGVWHVATVVFA